MKWRFFLDGRIESEFGFGAVSASCIAFGHTHHNYWRLDFDIDGAANDYAGDEISIPTSDADAVPAVAPIQTEQMRTLKRFSSPLIVQDSSTQRGSRILAKEAALEQPADTFSVGDVWLTRYNASQISDDGSAGCATSLSNYMNGESIYNQDLVAWVRGGAFHEASDLDDCHRTTIVLQPVGSWSP
jgi:Cu2+-containing amine oxidase